MNKIGKDIGADSSQLHSLGGVSVATEAAAIIYSETLSELLEVMRRQSRKVFDHPSCDQSGAARLFIAYHWSSDEMIAQRCRQQTCRRIVTKSRQHVIGNRVRETNSMNERRYTRVFNWKGALIGLDGLLVTAYGGVVCGVWLRSQICRPTSYQISVMQFTMWH
jgi:hypothetical protein